MNSEFGTMKTITASLALLLTTFFIAPKLFAQEESKFGKDSVECLKQTSLYREYYKQKSYTDAYRYWLWVFQHCPRSSKNIYLDGVEIFKDRIEKEKDAAKKEKLIDSLMLIYDMRIKYFNEEGTVLGRKGVDLAKYAPKRKKETYDILKKSFEMEGKNTFMGALQYLFFTANELMKEDVLSMDDMFALYDKIMAVINAKLAEKPDDASVKTVRDYVEQIFSTFANCPKFIETMKPKLDAAPNDTALLVKILKFLDGKKCTDDPLYEKAAVNLYKVSPTATAAASIAKMKLAKGNENEAIKYLKEAIDLESDASVKADLLYLLAQVQGLNLKQYSEARTNALKAASLKPNWGEPYILIGDLYLSTAASCGDNECNKKYGYWAAADKYNYAKTIDPSVAETAGKKAGTAKNYFPEKKDCFFWGINEDDSVTVGGWIGESTKARFSN